MLSELAARMRAIRDSFEEGNVIALRVLSNKAISEAALKGDRLLAEISLIAYSLHKMSIKTHITQNKRWGNVKATILRSLNDAIEALEEKNIETFERELAELSERVIETDEELGNYVANIYEKARIKMASSAYGLGLSLSQAAQLTGADKKQLLNYIGITKMHDEVKEARGIESRLKKLRGVLQE